jgi:leucyl-tRNA synthetase
VNPYYDAFVRWHFEVLREKQKIKFGTRNSIFSPIDDQACADHDRSAGEGAGISDFTLIKLKLLEFPEEIKTIVASLSTNDDVKALCEASPEAAAALAEPTVFLPAATLRPETMYGQTNLFVLPTGDYGVYVMKNGDIFVCSARSALNMSFQNMTFTRGKPLCLGQVVGQVFMGFPVSAPLATYERVYILPLTTIKMNKGTGVVTSVPSDAPDDYAALMDLKNKAPFRAKYGLADEHVLPFDVVPIIHTPNVGNPPTAEGEGNCPARDLCIEMKVASQNDKVKLELIKDKCYKGSFNFGVMAVGEYKGQPVNVAKPKIKAALVAAGLGALYAEPDTYVESRTGNECVVAQADQWYLEYGEEKWQAQIREHNDTVLNTYSHDAKIKFSRTIEWLKEWACSRTFGLGTRLPWDEKWVVESLSDSTIYMAYYTIAHFLQGGVIDGSQVGPAGIRADQMTVPVFNYIFRHKSHPDPPETDIPVAVLDQMRTEFEYWYPWDLRVSGKDLIGNHLTMSLYNHAAVWEESPEYMPRSIFTNGHLMINAQKMSKSTGNFMTMSAALKKFGSDATRFALADAGDGLEDANFEENIANACILRLTTEEAWLDSIKQDPSLTGDAESTFFEDVFENQINCCIVDTKTHMDNMEFHKALVSGVLQLYSIRDEYRASVDHPLSRSLIMRWFETLVILISPFCPHFAQHMWKKLGHNGVLINEARWPVAGEVNEDLRSKHHYLVSVAHSTRAALQNKMQPKKKKKGPAAPIPQYNTATFHVSREYNAVQQACLRIMTTKLEEGTAVKALARACSAELKALPEVKAAGKKGMQGCMQFVGHMGKEYAARGVAALALTTPFDELKFLNDDRVKSYIMRGSNLTIVHVLESTDDGTKPGSPSVHFSVTETDTETPTPTAE